MICSKCPKGSSSSGGSLQLRGDFKEFDNSVLKIFKNNCYLSVFDEIQANKECTSWNINSENSALESGSTNRKDVKFYSELILTTHLINPGKVYFS